MNPSDASSDIHRLQIDGKEVILVGTAHVSTASVDLVERVIQDEKPDTVCVCCPYCLTMFADGLKTKESEDKLKVLELAEIVAMALK